MTHTCKKTALVKTTTASVATTFALDEVGACEPFFTEGADVDPFVEAKVVLSPTSLVGA